MVTDRARGVDTPAPPEREPPTRAVSAQHQLRRHIYAGVAGPPDKEGNPSSVYVAVFSGKRGRDGKLHSQRTAYFRWPQDAAKITRTILDESNSGREAYQCAHLLTGKRRIKPNAALLIALYVDGDGAQPGPDLPQPTATVESSPGRQQFYWRLTRPIDPIVGEQLNKRLANAMRADMSGWDLTQILRPPDTRNWKYDQAPTVKLISIEDRAYDPDELERILPELPAEAAARAEVKLDRSPAAAPIGDRDQRARERMYRSKRGSELQHLASGGSVRSKPEGGPDHSADDQSYANGLAFWFDKDASRIAAEMWRSNRVRDKWHEIHFADGSTYLEGTIGKAISACSQSFRDLAGYDAGDEPPKRFTPPDKPTVIVEARPAPVSPSQQPTTLEEALVIIAQQNQEIEEYRESNRDLMGWVERAAGLEEDRQAIIAHHRERLDVLEPYVAYIQDVVTRDETECPSDDKVVLIGFVPWLQSYRAKQVANGESTAFHLKYGAKVIGMHPKRLSSVLGRWSSPNPNEGAPWYKTVTRTAVTNEDGTTGWDSALEVTPWRETTREILSASLAYVPPSKPKKGGSEEATAHRWRRCTKHPHADVNLQGRCSIGGELLGEVRVTPEEFDALKSRFVLSEDTRATVDDRYLSRDGNGISERRRDHLKVQPVVSEPPTTLFDYAASRRPDPPPTRCPAPGCTALGFRQHPDGSWRCLKSAHDPNAYVLAVAGGES